MRVINKPAMWLKFFYGNAIFWFLAGFIAQGGSLESKDTEVSWVYFHGFSVFFILAAASILGAVIVAERNKGNQLVNFKAPNAWLWLIGYTLVRIVAFGAGAFMLALLVLERIDSDYGYGYFALILYVPASLVALVISRFVRDKMVKRGILQPLESFTEGQDGVGSIRETSPQMIAALAVTVGLLLVVLLS